MDEQGGRAKRIAQYSSPGPDGKPKRHIETFKTKKEAAAWLARYCASAIDAIDLFPGTSHVETVVTLVRPPK